MKPTQFQIDTVKVIGVIVAILLAFWGQNLLLSKWPVNLTSDNILAIGGALLITSGVLMAVLLPSSYLNSFSSYVKQNSAYQSTLIKQSNHIVIVLLFFLPILLCIFAINNYISSGEDGFVRAIWLTSVILLISVSAIYNLTSPPHPHAESSPPFKLIHWVIIGALVIGGFWLRYNHLDTLPMDLHGDMASMGLGARDILSGKESRFFAAAWAGIQLLAYQYESLFMRLFGNNLFGLNTSAVFSGVAILPGTYALVWRTSDSHRLAILTTFLVTINVSAIHFSRLAAYTAPWFFGVWSVFFFIDGLRARKNMSFTLAGLGTAVCLQMYFSSRSVPFIMLGFLVYAFIFQRSWVTQNLNGFLCMLIGVVIGLGPALIYIFRNFDIFMARSREVFLFTDGVMAHTMHKFNQTTLGGVLQEQIKRGLLMFNYYGDSSTQFGWQEPMFPAELSPFVSLGLFISLFRLKRPLHALAIIWWITILVIGVILTVDPPFWPRLQGMPIVGSMFAAIAIAPILQILEQLSTIFLKSSLRKNVLSSKLVNTTTALIWGLSFVFLIWSGLQTWEKYYEFATVKIGPFAATGRVISQTQESTTVCLVTDPLSVEIREIAFLGYPRKLINISPNEHIEAAENKCIGESVIWIITPNHKDWLGRLASRWPNGVKAEYKVRQDVLIFTSYLIQ